MCWEEFFDIYKTIWNYLSDYVCPSSGCTTGVVAVAICKDLTIWSVLPRTDLHGEDAMESSCDYYWFGYWFHVGFSFLELSQENQVSFWMMLTWFVKWMDNAR